MRESEVRVRGIVSSTRVVVRIGQRPKHCQPQLLRLDRCGIVADRFVSLRDPTVGVRQFDRELGLLAEQPGERVACFHKRRQCIPRELAIQLHNAEILRGVPGFQPPVGVGGVNLDQLLSKFPVFQEGTLCCFGLAASIRDVADPIDALGMLEDSLLIVRRACEGLLGGRRRARECGERLVQPAALLADLADQVQGRRATSERPAVQAVGVLLRVVGEGLCTDGIEHVEVSNGLKLLAQVPEHEPEQVFRMGVLPLRFGARSKCGDGEHAHHRHAGNRSGREHRHPPRAPLGVAAHQLIDAVSRAHHPGQDLQRRESLAVAVRAQVRRDDLDGASGSLPVLWQRKAQRLRETFLRLAPGYPAGEGLAARDERNHALLAVEALELLDLPGNPLRTRGVGAADHNQVAARRESGAHCRSQVDAGR